MVDVKTLKDNIQHIEKQLDKEREISLQCLTKHWRNFFNKFNEIEKVKVSQWNHTHLLGYFDLRFRVQYNKNFSYTYKGPPSKCTEIVLIKRMCAMLSTMDMQVAKDYIDWVFEHKVIPNNMKIRSLGLFGHHGFGNEFREFKEKAINITRGTKLPINYITVAKRYDPNIKTYGDLAFAKLAISHAGGGDAKDRYQNLFKDLYTVGFNDNMIKGIK